MTSFKEYWNNNLDKNLTEVQMLQKVMKLKSKESVEFEIKNLKEDKLSTFKKKIKEMKCSVDINPIKIIVTKN